MTWADLGRDIEAVIECDVFVEVGKCGPYGSPGEDYIARAATSHRDYVVCAYGKTPTEALEKLMQEVRKG